MGEAFARLGIDPTTMHLVDPKLVDKLNIAPQCYDQADVGRPKVVALADKIERITCGRPNTYYKSYDGKEALSGYVFLCLDSLEGRDKIWCKSIRKNRNIVMMFDIGIGDANGKYFGVRPDNPVHIERYEAHRARDRRVFEEIQKTEASTGTCATKQNVGPTADIICGIAKWQFMKWIQVENGGNEPFENLIAFSMKGQATPANEFWE